MTREKDKHALRRHFRALRRTSLAAVQDRLRQVALERLIERLPPGRCLGLYWPVGSEPDLALLAPGGLAETLAGRLALPAVLADSGPAAAVAAAAAEAQRAPGAGSSPERLVYLPWDGTPPRGCDGCGIPAPLLGDGSAPVPLPPEALGLLLVPALAIDRRGIRLGSGGGWYDRLRSDPAWRVVPAVAVLPSACVVERLPRDPWDVPFDGWLDEHGLHALEMQPGSGGPAALRLGA
jgi:5-formyltetrahydrofolate cyclo-ligase